VLDHCRTVRGILNGDQGGPLQPPGLRLADALDEVRFDPAEPGREKRVFAEQQLCKLAGCIDRGRNEVRDEQESIRKYVKDVEEVTEILEPGVRDIRRSADDVRGTDRSIPAHWGTRFTSRGPR
jgi:hypothetical protein